MLENLIHRQIQACESFAAGIREALPYADGQAYYADQQQLTKLHAEADAWREILRIVRAAAQPGGAP